MGLVDRMELLCSARMLVAERACHGATPLVQLPVSVAVDLVEKLERAGHQFAGDIVALTDAIADRVNSDKPGRPASLPIVNDVAMRLEHGATATGYIPTTQAGAADFMGTAQEVATEDDGFVTLTPAGDAA